MARRGDRETKRRNAEVLPQSFIHSEEKCFVLLDRPSEGAAKLVASKGGQPAVAGSGFVVEEIARIERAVPEIFKHGAVERVRTAFGDEQDLTSHGHAIFGAEG